VLKKLFLTIFLIQFLACNPLESSKNSKPEIKEITYSPKPAKIPYAIHITAVATDKDGDDLTYYWSCSAGSFNDGYSDKNPTKWGPGSNGPGNYTITCTVSDGKDTASKSISINVIQ